MSEIYLVSFGQIQPGLLNDLSEELGKHFALPVISNYRHTIPEDALNRERNQYMASAFLSKLRRVTGTENSKLLGITEVDLFSTGLNFVFGQADVGGKASVISLARLHPQSADDMDGLFQERILKEAVHELGHTFGLEHCRDHRCVMHFSNGIAETDIKAASFCVRHKAEFETNKQPVEAEQTRQQSRDALG